MQPINPITPITRDAGKLNSTLNRKSRYASGGTTEVSENRIEWWERTIFKPNPDTDSLYVIEKKFEGNLRLISALFYNTDIHWWVIAQYNNILDPFSEVVEGVVLRIPAKESIDSITQGKTGGVPSQRGVNLSSLN